MLRRSKTSLSPSKIWRPATPSTIGELFRRIAEAAGVSRVGNRIRTALHNGVKYALRLRMVKQQGNFIWRTDMVVPPVRSHANLADYSRSLEQIAPEEFEQAILRVVNNSFGMVHADIANSVCSLLGFGRTSGRMREELEATVQRMLKAGKLAERSGFIVATRQ